MWISAVTLPVSVLFLTIGSFGNKLIYNLVSKLKILFLVEPFASYFTNSMIKYGLTLLIISIVSFLLHFLIKRFKNRNKKEQKEVGKKSKLAMN